MTIQRLSARESRRWIEDARAEFDRRGFDFVAMSRDGAWYRGERYDGFPFHEGLTIRMYDGENLVCVRTEVLDEASSERT